MNEPWNRLTRAEFLSTLAYGWLTRHSIRSRVFKVLAYPLLAGIGRVVARADRENRGPYQLIASRFFGLSVGRMSYGFVQLFNQHVEAVGAFCSIAPGLRIVGVEHPTAYVSTHPFLYLRSWGFLQQDRPMDEGFAQRNKKVRIGNDVWIGEDVRVLRGVRIGDGAVIGAAALVTRDVEPYSIVAGVPARSIRYRFSEDIRARLLELRWWDWTNEEIKHQLDRFYDPRLFVLTAGSQPIQTDS